MSQSWIDPFGSSFAASRRTDDALSSQTQVAKVLPTDLGIDRSRLNPIPSAKAPTPNSVNPMQFGNGSLLGLTVGLTDQLVLPSPTTKRVYLLIQNTHATQNLYVNFGANASVNSGIRIIAGGNYELTQFIPQDDIHIIADGINTTGVLVYSNKGTNEGI